MKVLPPSPARMALNQALAAKPIKRLTPEAARAQAAGHLAEARAEFWKGPEFARIARRQKWIDQSQSLNLFLPQADLKALSHLYRAAWRAGLKTTYNHLQPPTTSAPSAPPTSRKPPSASISVKKDVRITNTPEDPIACSLEARARGEECESCQ